MKFILILISLLISYSAYAQRDVSNINLGWKYLENNYTNISEASQDNNWQDVDLPHTWNNLDATDQNPGYRRDGSWYQKKLTFDKIEDDKRYILYFEGANLVTEVYVNEKLSGKHIGGYVGFEVDITDQIQEGENTLMIRVDNSYNREVIPSQKSDFFIYGGITRDVWLRKVNQTYISSVKVSTPQVTPKKGTTVVVVSLNQKANNNSKIVLEVSSPEGKIIETKEVSMNEQLTATLQFTIKNPSLWSVEDPSLYKAKIQLYQNGNSKDSYEVTYGYRWFEFKDYGAFYLNGERLLLRGTHRHEEHAGYGAAMPNKLHRRDIELVKEMGANFIRLGHYPQDPEIYKACNELGIIVWDELPWCRGGIGNETWKNNTRNLLKEMIDQNYNHPSIVTWSLGNEIYWLPDFEDGDNTNRINSFLTELNDIAHKMDPYRVTSIRKYYEGAGIVDVFSPSIWSGWYSGSYKNYRNAIENSFSKYPHFIHMEYGGSSHFSRHSENPIDGNGLVNPSGWEEAINQIEVVNIAQTGDWSENYIVDLFDWHLSVSETYPDFVGNAQWAIKDFGTPLRPENDIPYMNQKGLMDREGNPKDAYFVFKSYWSDVPFAYIESHTWTERSGPEGLDRNVSVYSNAKEVELFLNGKSQGKKKKDISQFPASGLNWDIDFREGNNKMQAIGYIDNKQVAEDTLTVNYRFEKAEAPQKLALEYELLENGNYLVSAVARDKNGLRCLDYEEKVYFQCLTGGDLLESQGTPTGSSVISMANGKASIILMPNESGKNIQVTVLNQSFKGSFLEISQK